MPNSPCPHCGNLIRYIDPLGTTRCITCFNHVAGTASISMQGQLQDTEAPMVIMGTANVYTYPNAFTRLGR